MDKSSNAMRALIVLSVAASLSGCELAQALDHTARDPSNRESIIIMKSGPADFKLMFFPGTVKNDQFTQGFLGNARISALPKEGYIAVRTKAGETLGLTSVTKIKFGISFIGHSFEACGGASAIVFEVPKARVVYLGDIDYEESAGRIVVRYSQDIAGAAAHLRKSFPEIRRELEPLQFRILRTGHICTSNIVTIPVYVGR